MIICESTLHGLSDKTVDTFDLPCLYVPTEDHFEQAENNKHFDNLKAVMEK